MLFSTSFRLPLVLPSRLPVVVLSLVFPFFVVVIPRLLWGGAALPYFKWVVVLSPLFPYGWVYFAPAFSCGGALHPSAARIA